MINIPTGGKIKVDESAFFDWMSGQKLINLKATTANGLVIQKAFPVYKEPPTYGDPILLV